MSNDTFSQVFELNSNSTTCVESALQHNSFVFMGSPAVNVLEILLKIGHASTCKTGIFEGKVLTLSTNTAGVYCSQSLDSNADGQSDPSTLVSDFVSNRDDAQSGHAHTVTLVFSTQIDTGMLMDVIDVLSAMPNIKIVAHFIEEHNLGLTGSAKNFAAYYILQLREKVQVVIRHDLSKMSKVIDSFQPCTMWSRCCLYDDMIAKTVLFFLCINIDLVTTTLDDKVVEALIFTHDSLWRLPKDYIKPSKPFHGMHVVHHDSCRPLYIEKFVNTNFSHCGKAKFLLPKKFSYTNCSILNYNMLLYNSCGFKADILKLALEGKSVSSKMQFPYDYDLMITEYTIHVDDESSRKAAYDETLETFTSIDGINTTMVDLLALLMLDVAPTPVPP